MCRPIRTTRAISLKNFKLKSLKGVRGKALLRKFPPIIPYIAPIYVFLFIPLIFEYITGLTIKHIAYRIKR